MVGYSTGAYSTFSIQNAGFVCMFSHRNASKKHKTQNTSQRHSWLASLGSLCSARVRVRPLTLVSRCALAAQGEDGGSAVELASLGLHRGWRRARLGGGSGTCFACVARLALVRICGVLGVVRWQGNRRHYWGVGSGVLALGRCRGRPLTRWVALLARVPG